MILRTLMITTAALSLAACQPKSVTGAQGDGPQAPAVGDQRGGGGKHTQMRAHARTSLPKHARTHAHAHGRID